MELKCAVQHYHWGRVGLQSEVASLMISGDSDFVLEDDKPYAELWMGSHLNGPSVIKKKNKSLGEWISAHPKSLGEPVVQKFGKELPFLFKVLSVNQSLSIQAHPNKRQAEMLHAMQPDVYKDPNHKPELAIALTPFEVMCGFRPVKEIQKFIQDIPELQTVIGEKATLSLKTEDESQLKVALRECFRCLMICEHSVLQNQLNLLVDRLQALDLPSQSSLQGNLLERLNKLYPGDVGCFCIYFLNHMILIPGEAIYLGAGEPHAYLNGDCIECMACSDNVVRAGLTPKLKDVETLCNMLTYTFDPPATKLFKAKDEDEYTKVFKPPVPDFAVAQIKVPNGTKNYTIIQRSSASILLVVKGAAKTETSSLMRGKVYFLPAGQMFSISVESAEPLIMFQAFCNV